MPPIGPEHERRRPSGGEGFADAVTVAFGDPRADVYGLARIGLTDSGASGLGLLFADREPVAAVAQGGIPATGGDWDDVGAAGVRLGIEQPLARWTAGFETDDAAFDVRLEAVGEPVAVRPAAGMEGYEQLCRVVGTASAGGRRRDLRCLGQRTHAWGTADWDGMALARTVEAWLAPDAAVGLFAVRPAGAEHHEAERVSAYLAGTDGPAPVAEARLSTTYDEQGRQLRAGAELWTADDRAHRLAGEALCGSTLDLGRLRWDCAFFRWRSEGREGVGRYDVLRRSA